ncbi:MAG: hypothetical protein N5P05_004251 (plasmid) [Chroococcopsis gigantea SAG 12.99]|jgi:hypothetical protein|nr:hypothetical protein [Chroococcopsis gigantea SAG 12.99]
MEYLNKCQGEIEVSLTIQSTEAKAVIPSPLDENGERDYQRVWNRWLTEVDQMKTLPMTKKE